MQVKVLVYRYRKNLLEDNSIEIYASNDLEFEVYYCTAWMENELVSTHNDIVNAIKAAHEFKRND